MHLLRWRADFCRTVQNFLYGLETTSFQSGFKFLKHESLCWGSVGRIGRIGHCGSLVLYQITANEVQRGSRRIGLVEYPSLACLQFRSLPARTLLAILDQLSDDFHKPHPNSLDMVVICDMLSNQCASPPRLAF